MCLCLPASSWTNCAVYRACSTYTLSVETKVTLSHFLNHWVCDWPHLCTHNVKQHESLLMYIKSVKVVVSVSVQSPAAFLPGYLQSVITTGQNGWSKSNGNNIIYTAYPVECNVVAGDDLSCRWARSRSITRMIHRDRHPFTLTFTATLQVE